jgi:hypothetical protein
MRIEVLFHRMNLDGTYDLINAWDRENVNLIDSKVFLVHNAFVLASALARVVERLWISNSDEM